MLTPEGYRPRLIDARISQLMNIYGAVCVEGPKWCGKTWTSRNHAESATFIGDPAGSFMNKQLAEMDASLVLEGKFPRLIDEWQVVPAIWDAVRYKVDQTGNKGQYILMHSVIYRTRLLRKCGIELPKHTFYVDNERNASRRQRKNRKDCHAHHVPV